VNTVLTDCNINNQILRGLWAFSFSVAQMNFLKSIPRIRIRWNQFQDTKARKREQNQKYGLRQNRGMASMSIYAGLMHPCLTAFGLMMMIDPSQRIGLDYAPTFIFFITKIAFYGCIYVFQPALIASVLQGNKSTKWVIRVNYIWTGLACVLGIIGGALPLITLFASDNGSDDLAVAIYFLYQSLTVFQVILLGVQAYWTMKKVAEALDLSYSITKSERSLEIKDALNGIEKENILQAIIQSFVYSLFVVFPFMVNSHNYFLPIGWLAYSILGKKLCFTTLADSKYGSKTSGSSKTSNSIDDEPKTSDSNSQSRSTSYNFAQRLKTFNPMSRFDSKTAQKYKENVTSFVDQGPVEDDEGWA